jgi:cyanophycinase
VLCLVNGPLAMNPASPATPSREQPTATAVGGRPVKASASVVSSLPAVANPRTLPGIPGGTLVLAGGGRLPDSIRECFLQLAGGKQARLVIIPSASARIDAAARSLVPWKTANVQSIRLLHTTRRADADDQHCFGLLQDATAVWISGGDQARLAAIYGGTSVERELRGVLRRGGVIGGTSAGASIVSGVMMAEGGKAAKGFGLIAHTIIDQHFDKRHRLPRLRGLLHGHPDQVGIGIDERTAVVIRGTDLSVLGLGTVTVAWPDNPRTEVYGAGSSHFPLPMPLSVASSR